MSPKDISSIVTKDMSYTQTKYIKRKQLENISLILYNWLRWTVVDIFVFCLIISANLCIGEVLESLISFFLFFISVRRLMHAFKGDVFVSFFYPHNRVAHQISRSKFYFYQLSPLEDLIIFSKCYLNVYVSVCVCDIESIWMYMSAH